MTNTSTKTPKNLGDVRDLLFEEIRRKFGRLGIFIIAVLIIAGTGWWQWDKVKNLPGIPSIMHWISTKPLPTADPNRFSVAVAHLQNDKDNQYEQFIVEELKQFQGVQPLQFDRLISFSGGGNPEQEERAGHETARRYLNESKADALIWGMIHRIDNQSALRLFWTTATSNKRPEKVYELTNFQLPELFWNDFREVFRFVIVGSSSRFFGKESEFISDQLAPFVQKVLSALKEAKNSSVSSETRTAMNLIIARCLVILGQQTGKNEPLTEAVRRYRDAVKELNSDENPGQWAVIHFQLGITLLELGTRESGAEQLKSAMLAFEEALRFTSREHRPEEWARIRSAMGETFRVIGERQLGTDYLKQAVGFQREALTILTRKASPRGWAAAQRDLGNALTFLGMRQSDKNSAKNYLEEAVTAFTEAMKEETRKQAPRDWAGNQMNMGIALFELGVREPESETEHLRQAVEASRLALEVQTRDRVPLDWARTQDNLGSALSVLGRRQTGTTHLWEAVTAFNESLKEKSRIHTPRDWAITQNNLGNTFWVIGEREPGTKSLEQAVRHYHQALTVITRENSPAEWTEIQANLNGVLALIRRRQKGLTLSNFLGGQIWDNFDALTAPLALDAHGDALHETQTNPRFTKQSPSYHSQNMNGSR